MAIQWFPGHMTSAKKKATETMERIDVVIEVLDARVPEAGSNPMIREMREHEADYRRRADSARHLGEPIRAAVGNPGAHAPGSLPRA